jgi:16S rRNA (uracil1498-N3)-methyltransferase
MDRIMSASSQRSPRLFIERDLDSSTLELDQPEAHYLGHVLRLKRGDRLVVFNGRGAERDATVDVLQRHGATLTLGTSRAALPDSPLELTLIQALPKADAMDLIVQKITELGVRTLVPVYTDFSVVKLDAERSERRVEHWRKIARSACEQCGRHRPPHIEPPAALATALEALPAGPDRLALQPFASRTLAEQAAPAHGLVVAVGPEGGFGAADRQRLDAAQFVPVALGPRVLRAETAAMAVCAVVQSRWGDLRG